MLLSALLGMSHRKQNGSILGAMVKWSKTADPQSATPSSNLGRVTTASKIAKQIIIGGAL